MGPEIRAGALGGSQGGSEQLSPWSRESPAQGFCGHHFHVPTSALRVPCRGTRGKGGPVGSVGKSSDLGVQAPHGSGRVFLCPRPHLPSVRGAWGGGVALLRDRDSFSSAGEAKSSNRHSFSQTPRSETHLHAATHLRRPCTVTYRTVLHEITSYTKFHP